MRIGRPLDRYVFAEFIKIFLATALGFPLLLIVIDVTEHVQGYLERHLSVHDVALSYVYWIPDSMFMVLPAAVLFATVFSIGGFTRHSEITAAKASGISFYRLIAPILFASVLACGLDLGLGELLPLTNQRRSELLQEDKAQVGDARYNFAFAGEYGRVYKAYSLRTDSGTIQSLQIERKGSGPKYPTYVLSAQRGKYVAPPKDPRGQGTWTLNNGSLEVVSDTGANFTMTFQTALDRHFTEHPTDMMAKQRDPHDMRYAELTRAIQSAERSGSDANLSRVERALKLAVPVTCIIIALFGAPLATSTQRGGSAYGVAVSLATTMIFLLMIQLTRAIGGKGVISPDFAAWIPGLLFTCVGLILLARVRT